MNRSTSVLFGWARYVRTGLAVSVALALFATFAPFVPGCSSGSGGGTSSPCPTCAAGNQCLDDGSGSGPTCHEVCTAQTCPFGWYCNDGASQGQAYNWCVQATAPVPATTGQWGTPCLASGGENNNAACDSADSFACYGVSPVDAGAYCTTFGCSQDTDCPGGWWCETVDTAPNVTTAKRTFGKTRSVCTPRRYCSTCTMDHDCSPASDGTQQHCVQDSNGAGYCTPQCGSSANCALDAKCVSQWSVCTPAQGTACKSDDDCPAVSGTFQHCDAGACTPECGSASDCSGTGQACTALSTCQPNAGVCLGTGDFCSPCRADSDCMGGGYCVYAQWLDFASNFYSTERYCSVPVSSGTCPASTTVGLTVSKPSPGQCPKAPAGSSAAVSGLGGVVCTPSSYSTRPGTNPPIITPPDQCIALTSFPDGSGGHTSVVGCWTRNL